MIEASPKVNYLFSAASDVITYKELLQSHDAVNVNSLKNALSHTGEYF